MRYLNIYTGKDGKEWCEYNTIITNIDDAIEEAMSTNGCNGNNYVTTLTEKGETDLSRFFDERRQEIEDYKAHVKSYSQPS